MQKNGRSNIKVPQRLSKKQIKREAMAVTGYIEPNQIHEISTLKQIDIWPDRDIDNVVIRVNRSDVEEIRIGSTEAGRTIVQLILRKGAKIETSAQTTSDPSGLDEYHDPILNRVRQEATAKKILL